MIVIRMTKYMEKTKKSNKFKANRANDQSMNEWREIIMLIIIIKP